jgi:hypothetical protein
VFPTKLAGFTRFLFQSQTALFLTVMAGLVPAIHVGPTLETLRQAHRRGYPGQARA